MCSGVLFKKNKETWISGMGNALPKESPAVPRGPFAQCGNCPYARHGFVCWHKEGGCMKTDVRELAQRQQRERERRAVLRRVTEAPKR